MASENGRYISMLEFLIHSERKAYICFQLFHHVQIFLTALLFQTVARCWELLALPCERLHNI